MRVDRFTDQIEEVATLQGLSPAELEARDDRLARPPQRWLAYDGTKLAGVATAWLRPDDRLFVSFAGPVLDATRVLSLAISRELSRPLYASAHDDDVRLVAGLLHAGYSAELVAEKFEVPFAPILDLVGGMQPARGYSLISAASADLDTLATLDSELRRLVPGSDGWVSTRRWVSDEIDESPPFDPKAYMVGVAPDGALAGLARIWRNPGLPRFGLVGVKPEHRKSRLGPALIAAVVGAASTWGHERFETETSIGNRHIHPRLLRLGAEPKGFVYQFVFATAGSRERRDDEGM